MPTSFSDWCLYRGVTCDSNNQSSTYHYVTGIKLHFANGDLNGTDSRRQLPYGIGYFPALQSLDLYNAFEGGTMPDSIGNLHALTYLDVRGNSFTGPMPDIIGNLEALTYLDVRGNSFTGPMPDSIGYLTALAFLDLGYNYFSSSIPSSIGYLTALEELTFRANELTGTVPSSFNKLTNLKSLYLEDNYLTAGPSGVLSEDTFSDTTSVFVDGNCLQFRGVIGTNCERKFESVMTLKYCIQTIFTADSLHLWHSNSRYIIPDYFSV